MYWTNRGSVPVGEEFQWIVLESHTEGELSRGSKARLTEQISWVTTDLDYLASVLQVPVQRPIILEGMSLRLVLLVPSDAFKVLGMPSWRVFHDHQSTVIGSACTHVRDPLDGLWFIELCWVLVDVCAPSAKLTQGRLWDSRGHGSVISISFLPVFSLTGRVRFI